MYEMRWNPVRWDRLGWAVAGAAIAGLVIGLGCASPPEADPNGTTVWGYVRLAPKANAPRGEGGYGDRRLSDVKRVDYSHPRFAVVFVPDATPVASPPAELVIRDTGSGPRIEPEITATTLAAGVLIRNETGTDQLVSAPTANYLRRLKPAAVDRIDGLLEGELTMHLLGTLGDGHGPIAQVWVSPGRVARVEANGRFLIRGLEPGSHVLRAWHPRLPPTAPRAFDLERGDVERIDLEISVDSAHLESGAEK
jgi:hypothetical protein